MLSNSNLYRCITAGEHEGIVKEINFRCTVLERLDFAELSIPNAHFLRAAVLNVSRWSAARRIKLTHNP